MPALNGALSAVAVLLLLLLVVFYKWRQVRLLIVYKSIHTVLHRPMSLFAMMYLMNNYANTQNPTRKNKNKNTHTIQ